MMRVLCLNKRHEFEFLAGTSKHALAFGDLDNDGYDELAVGNEIGEVLIFKGREVWQKFTKLGFVTCLAIGDILNEGRNCLVVVTGEGFCHIYDSAFDSDDQAIEASEELGNAGPKDKHLIHIHTQRVPANVKNMLVADIDGDGRIELVLGLSDRVVRSYRWSSGRSSDPLQSGQSEHNRGTAKLIALNKWECAKQIGSITLHNNWEGKPCILVSQPGGTFMRIRCHADGSPSLKDQPPKDEETGPTSLGSDDENAQQSTVDYQSLGLSRMRSQEIATEIVGNIRTGTPIVHSKYDTSTYVVGGGTADTGTFTESVESGTDSMGTTTGAMGSGTVGTGSSIPVTASSGSKKRRRRRRKPRTSTSSDSTQGSSPTSSASTMTSTDTSVTTQIDTTKIDTAKLTKDFDSLIFVLEPDTDSTAAVENTNTTATTEDTKATLETSTSETDTVTSSKSPETEGSIREESESAASMVESKSCPYAVATLDGTIMLVHDEVILWALAVDHQIFAMGKLDVNNDGLDEIVACAWDGLVYFIDQNKTCVKFALEEPVQAFACGMFSSEKEKTPTPALAFITFRERLYIYFDVNIKQMAIKKYDPDLSKLAPYYVDENTTLEEAVIKLRNLPPDEKRDLLAFLFYDEIPEDT